jgi:hypothetical protein
LRKFVGGSRVNSVFASWKFAGDVRNVSLGLVVGDFWSGFRVFSSCVLDHKVMQSDHCCTPGFVVVILKSLQVIAPANCDVSA